jgi:septum site-determining protein MinC
MTIGDGKVSPAREEMMDKTSNDIRQAFKLKGTTPALAMLSLQTTDMDAIERQLAEHIAQMPQFFLHAPIMLDLEALGGTSLDFTKLTALLTRNRLVPVAVRNPTDEQKEQAIAAGWGVMQATLVRPTRATSSRARAEEPAPAAAGAEAHAATLTVYQPVRSGQVLYAPGGDLVVLAPVSSGAELVADGHIHVYAALRGRAIAGGTDNPRASIFCMRLEADFLGIAGRHLTSEQIPEANRGKPARVHLHNDELVVTAL